MLLLNHHPLSRNGRHVMSTLPLLNLVSHPHARPLSDLEICDEYSTSSPILTPVHCRTWRRDEYSTSSHPHARPLSDVETCDEYSTSSHPHARPLSRNRRHVMSTQPRLILTPVHLLNLVSHVFPSHPDAALVRHGLSAHTGIPDKKVDPKLSVRHTPSTMTVRFLPPVAAAAVPSPSACCEYEHQH
ncbi:hypothetical protein J6590_004956 [Homalodisca vitripennis]|nr:hypothetical protein J6590_004956 [Homalodisca vitripennis]